MNYHLSYSHPADHYLDIHAELDGLDQDHTELQFPAWRPGRYELANFAKNVRKFRVYDQNGKQLIHRKISKDKWEVETKGITSIVIEYSYFANELNAGSTYLDDQQLYVNPVNCFIYHPDKLLDPCSVSLDVPKNYQVASSLVFDDTFSANAKTYHELVDSPFIASATLQHNMFTCEGVEFHLWFKGECKIDWDKVLRDFKGYTVKQIEAFGSFPVQTYHYLFQITAYKSYHGVEHQASTVIALGPAYDLMTDIYDDFLGVSSHELYHTWNVKAVRAREMTPYDYSRENYSRLGYVAEGVTTYLGDVFLLKGKAFTIDQYLKEITSRVQAHFNNPGRFNLSVADSSYDTWLDGYTAGAPGRKVSIYTEGCLLAFILDIKIMKNSSNKMSIHDMMQLLVDRYADKGYTDVDYKSVAEEVSGEDLSAYFDEYVYGTRTLEGLLAESFDHIGLYISKTENESYAARVHGFKHNGETISTIADGSPAQMVGLSSGDRIVAINKMVVHKDVDKWLTYFKEDDQTLTVEREGRLIELSMPQLDQTFFRNYRIKQIDEPSRAQREAFNKWSSKKA